MNNQYSIPYITASNTLDHKQEIIIALQSVAEQCISLINNINEPESLSVLDMVSLSKIVSLFNQIENTKGTSTLSCLAVLFNVSESDTRTILLNRAKQRGKSLDTLMIDLERNNLEVLFE